VDLDVFAHLSEYYILLKPVPPAPFDILYIHISYYFVDNSKKLNMEYNPIRYLASMKLKILENTSL
jgi:hypothetical protein